MRIVWSPSAQADLAAIHAYYRDIAPEYAVKLATLIVAASRLLVENPKLGPVIEDSNYRKWRVAKTHDALIYRVEATDLRISRVAHAAQDWRAFL